MVNNNYITTCFNYPKRISFGGVAQPVIKRTRSVKQKLSVCVHAYCKLLSATKKQAFITHCSWWVGIFSMAHQWNASTARTYYNLPEFRWI